MKPQFSKHRKHALTLVEALVVVCIFAILAAILLPALAKPKRRGGPRCANNVKEIGLSYKIWAGDNNDKYPMQISMTNGGAMEMAAKGNATAIFQVMSNELGSPKILICPADTKRFAATNFTTDLKGKISYFVNVDASDAFPQMILAGDDNFEIGGVPVKSGLLEISTNTPIAWTAARHKFACNVGLADGSVQQVTQSGLRAALTATNRLAIP